MKRAIKSMKQRIESKDLKIPCPYCEQGFHPKELPYCPTNNNSLRLIRKIFEKLYEFKNSDLGIRDRIHVYPDLPNPKIQKTRLKCSKEKNMAIGLINLSLSPKKIKTWLAFGTTGVYYKNSMVSRSPGDGDISYDIFKHQHFALCGYNDVVIGNGRYLDVSNFAGVKSKKEDLINLLNGLADSLSQDFSGGQRLQKVYSVLDPEKNSIFLFSPEIEQHKEKVRKKFRILGGDEIIGIFGFNILGSFKSCFVFCEHGIYYKNPLGSYKPGRGFIPYRIFKKKGLKINYVRPHEIILGGQHALNISSLSGLEEGKTEIVNVLGELKKALCE